MDWTEKQPIPLIPQSPDPYEIAYLRGGENELARSLIFSLSQKGFLQITGEGKKSYITLTRNQPNWTTLPPIEKSILSWFQTTREIGEVFENYGLIERLKPFSLEFEQKIKQNNLLIPNDVKTKTRLISLLIFGLIALIGSYKLIASINHGRYNIIFLILFIIGSFVVFTILGKTKRLSERGKKYIAGLQSAFEKLKSNPTIAKQYYSQNMPVLNSVDPFLLTMGIFGTSALIGRGFNEYEKAFAKSQKQNSDSGNSSCGSSCGSSCSSGDSGSSCSGGSSCGGGCGGGCGGS
ncbi:MAG: TIGR04222 domain-containing membrane protein [Blastocatellia bacterium]|nr:TIGR04222 domain-containing membrane protein [Blastocatellia bacterium]